MKFLQHTSARTTPDAADRTRASLLAANHARRRHAPLLGWLGRGMSSTEKMPRRGRRFASLSPDSVVVEHVLHGEMADDKNVFTRRPLMHSILLVDDEPEILAAWRLILENEGYKVQCASNGVEAVKCLIAAIPDLIVTDLMMPLMDGAALCRHLKATPATANVPILLHTAVPAFAMEATGEWTMCLRKPVGADLFLKTVEQLCGPSQQATT